MHKLIIANWKMQLTHQEVRTWLKTHAPTFDSLLAQTNNTLVICPSYTELAFAHSLSTMHIRFGAQDCGLHERGAYTGDVSVLTLKELGCTYTLIGHSERRIYHGETDEAIAQKATLLLKHGIEPIICIGETSKERDTGTTLQVLENQLSLVAKLLGRETLTIAYEPVWAIGTQQVPRASEIASVFSWIRTFMEKQRTQARIKLLYGGSVNERTIEDLGLGIADGFLLGKASLDPQELKKILLKI